MASSKKKPDSDPKEVLEQDTDATLTDQEIAQDDELGDASEDAKTEPGLADEDVQTDDLSETEVSQDVDLTDQDTTETTLSDEKDTGTLASDAAPAPKKSGSGGLILGGVIAAALGAAATYFVLPLVPGLLPNPADDPQGQAIARLNEETNRLSDVATSNSGAIDDLAKNVSSLNVTDEISAIRDQISALQARVDELEARPVPSSAPSAETMQAVDVELGKLRTQVEDELARIREASAEVAQNEQAIEDRAEQAAALAALGRIQAAVDAGQPFADDLGSIRDAGLDVKDAVTRTAGEGVATLSELQESFPEAARSALNAAIDAETPDDAQGKVSAFFRKQLGVRSLEPRDGDSTDAKLSRAEAALRAGDLANTIDELSTLEGSAKDQMTTWISDATARLELKSALDTIAQELNM